MKTIQETRDRLPIDIYNEAAVEKWGLTAVTILSAESEQIFEAIAESDAGKYLATTTRWDRFKDAGRPESQFKWLDALGETAVILPHMRKFACMGEAFLILEKGRFTAAQERLLRLAFPIHDLGEAKIGGDGVGDVSAALKTLAHEKEEHRIGLAIIETLDLPATLKGELKEAYRKVVMGEDKELNFAFRALEYLEYLDTAMYAYYCYLLEDQGRMGNQFANSEFLIGRVLAYDLPKIRERYEAMFPNSIGRYLSSQASEISDAFHFAADYFDPRLIMINRPVFPDEDGAFAAAFAKSMKEWCGCRMDS